MKLNYYEFKTTDANAVNVLVKGLVNLAGTSAVVMCYGSVTNEGVIYASLTSPLPFGTIQAVAVAMASVGVNGANLIAGTLELRKQAEMPLVQSRRVTPSASLPDSGHSRFNPEQMSFPE